MSSPAPAGRSRWSAGGHIHAPSSRFAALDPASRQELLRQAVRLRRQVLSLQLLWAEQEFTDAHVFDALRQQVLRVVALGITGFDTPYALPRRCPKPPPPSPPWKARFACTCRGQEGPANASGRS